MQKNSGPRHPGRNDLGRVGVFGGTFDPIHYGHLICAEQMRHAIDLDLVMFIPCSQSPNKPDYVPASAEHRLAMARLAVEGYGCFIVSDIEIARGGMSYTIDTIRQLRDLHGAGVELWLLTGMDAYLDLRTWKDPEGIARECFFGVACRPGYTREELSFPPADRTRFVDISAVDISSTDIRRRLLEGETIRYLVPSSVEEYIRGNNPYPQASKG